ncbi:MAG: hypothetical protein RQ757_05025, partial [Pseudomonadales bacterium]|nr:hypothetical protein [Pseudomonadales bacterium]
RVDSDFTNISSVETLTLATAGSTTLGTTAQAAGIVTINGAGGAETIDASGYTAALTFNAGATGANVSTGSGDDNFVFDTGELDSGVTLDGNGGNDTISLSNTVAAHTATVDMDDLSDIEMIRYTDTNGAGTGSADTFSITIDVITETVSQTVNLDFSAITDTTDEVAMLNNAANATTKFSITGGAGQDTLIGSNGADTIVGGSGADSITGGAGNDSIVAGAGADTVVAGLGSDTITLGSGTDTDVDVVSFDKDTLITATSTVTDFDAGTATTSEDLISVGSNGNVTAWSAAATITQSTATATADARLIILDSQSFATVGDAASAADNLHGSGVANSNQYLFAWTDTAGDVHISWGVQDAATEVAVDQFTDLVELTGVSLSNLNLADFTFA